MFLFAQFQSQLQGRVPSPRNQLPFCSPDNKKRKNLLLETSLFCSLICIYVKDPEHFKRKTLATDIEHRVHTFNLRVNYLLIFQSAHMDIFIY